MVAPQGAKPAAKRKPTEKERVAEKKAEAKRKPTEKERVAAKKAEIAAKKGAAKEKISPKPTGKTAEAATPVSEAPKTDASATTPAESRKAHGLDDLAAEESRHRGAARAGGHDAGGRGFWYNSPYAL